MDGVSKKVKKEQEDEKKKLEEQLKVLSVLLRTPFLLFFVFSPLYLFDVFLFCVSKEPKSANLGNQGQAEEILFN